MTNIQRLIERLYEMPLRDLMCDLYIAKNKPTAEIATILGVSRATVDRWIKEFNIHYRKPVWNKGLSGEERAKVLLLKRQ